ncbi:hypothetical protein GCM10010428_12650 [Actinosynnema pretiosum subsp. pretiosum]
MLSRMTGTWIVIAGVVVGVVIGLALRPPGARREPATRQPPPRERLVALLAAADELERGLDAVLDFGPLSAGELAAVDLPAKLEHLVAPRVLTCPTVAELRACTEQIALHPFPEQRELLAAVRADQRPAAMSATWLVMREAAGSAAAQHHAAVEARRCLATIRDQLTPELPGPTPALV